MESKLHLYNTLTRKKEEFVPLHAPQVGMYVCGPTVYGDPHLGHARAAIVFDILFRYLQFLGYKVRYVRNITDVGHLESDADEGEDKIAKKARLDQLEPMEIVQHYTNSYHNQLAKLNVLSPSIEPRASGHILEQIELIQQILDNGYAYLSEGSVYFDVEKYHKQHHYGKLSGRILEDLYEQTRVLDGQQEKRASVDFALWKKAAPEHIMKWNSPWSVGFPGWHLECSAMGVKYLGQEFDIHGGGMDLMFPHHECEIAQNQASIGKDTVKYWIHNNMITINNQKMGKSLGNFITLEELFSGNHRLLVQAYSPMTIRYFILTAHYGSTLDFSNEALQGAEKACERLLGAYETLGKIKPSENSNFSLSELKEKVYMAMNDDLNTPVAIAQMFDLVRTINSVYAGNEQFTLQNIEEIKLFYNEFVFNILGLQTDQNSGANTELMGKVVDLLLNLRIEMKAKKDFATSDKIRNELTALGFEIKDKKDGFDWKIMV